MQKIKCFTYFYHSVLCEIKFNHSANINYNNFGNIYREYTKEPYSFLIIDTTLPASNPLRFRKDLIPLYKNDSN